MGTLKFKIQDLEEVYTSLVEIKSVSNQSHKEINLFANEGFLSPIDGIHINFAISQLDNNKVSILGIIKKDLLNDKELDFTCDFADFSIRNINNFGIYISAGRPDLSLNEEFTPYLDLEDKDLFIKKLKSFESLIESAINQIYFKNRLDLDTEIYLKLNLVRSEASQKIEQTENQEIPEALKRLYEKLGNL